MVLQSISHWVNFKFMIYRHPQGRGEIKQSNTYKGKKGNKIGKKTVE